MSEMTARQHALRIAALEALADAVAAEYEKARREAEPVFAAKYADDGNDRQAVMLPGGEKIGQITIKAPVPDVSKPEGAPAGWRLDTALLDWCAEHFPAAVEEYIDPAKVSSLDVIAAVRDKLPDVIKTRVRPATAKALAEEIRKGGGLLADRHDGEAERIATVTAGKPTGAFAFTGANSGERRQRLMAELVAGRLAGVIGFGPLALPAPEVLAADAVVVPPADDGPAPQEPGTAAGEPASDAELARIEWKRWLAAPAAGASDIGRSLAEAAGWRLVSVLGHSGCDGWTYDRRTGLTCSCGAVLDEPEKAGAAS